jgi:hypothetical protein
VKTIYVPAAEIEAIGRNTGTAIRFSRPTNISMIHKDSRGNKTRFVSSERFDGIDPRDLRDRCENLGWQAPTSLGSIWRNVCPSIPQISGALGRYLERETYGGWQDDFPEHGPGPWNIYDIRSAYGWAGSVCPLPDTETAYLTGDAIVDDHYYAVSWNPTRDIPDALREKHTMMWGWEINGYGLDVIVNEAWKFTNWIDIAPQISLIVKTFPPKIHKHILRQYWGTFESTAPLYVKRMVKGEWTTKTCGSRKAAFRKSGNQYNPLWARTICGRIWLRCWQAKTVRNVYVDCVYTDQTLRTGESMGDWVSKGIINAKSEGPGWVWDAETGRNVRHCGSTQAVPLPRS